MTVRARTLPLAVAAALILLAVAVTGTSPSIAAAKSRSVQLKAFQSCSNLIRYGNRNITKANVPMRHTATAPMAPAMMEDGGGRPAPAAAPGATAGGGTAGVDFSTTNVQEAGVDEPDIVKTNGAHVFAIARGKLHAVDVSGDAPRLVGSLQLESGGRHELLLYKDKALVTWTAYGAVATPDAQTARPAQQGAPAPAAAPAPGYYAQPATVIAEVDVRDPAAMKVLRRHKVDGSVVSSRLNGATARVVITSMPRGLLEPQPAPATSEGSSGKTRTAPVSRKRAAHWLPSGVLQGRRVKRVSRRALVACRAVRRTPSFSGHGMLTVLTIDLEKGLPAVDSDSIMTDAETVYASEQSLYVATRRHTRALPETGVAPEGVLTSIHKFDISDSQSTVYKASGQVPGFLLSQFSLSEHKGVLRAASTNVPLWWAGTQIQLQESFVTVLDEVAGRLVPVGAVGGLGRGERIYAVRFIGDAGYVVTFRQVDPLYTLDMSNPSAPKVLGELKILGYSAYLHPAGDDLLIGVGQDATEEGMRRGAQVSLFDVSDLSNPTRLAQRGLGDYSQSEVDFDHHAFLYWQPTKLAVIPVQVYAFDSSSGKQPFSGAVGFTIDRAAGITETGRVAHDAADYRPAVRRSLVVRDRLFTLSEVGLKSSRLDTLADVAWVGFG